MSENEKKQADEVKPQKKKLASQSFVDRMTSGMADPHAASEDEITDEERRIFGLPPKDED